MSINTVRGDLETAYRTTMVIGLGLIASVGGYVVVAELIKTGVIGGYEYPLASDDPAYGILKYALLGLSFLDLLVIKVIGSLILSGGSPPAQRLMTKSIISMAICESVAIYGLVLFLLAGSRLDFYLFTVVSLIFFGVFFPRYHRWEEWIKSISPETLYDKT